MGLQGVRLDIRKVIVIVTEMVMLSTSRETC